MSKTFIRIIALIAVALVISYLFFSQGNSSSSAPKPAPTSETNGPPPALPVKAVRVSLSTLKESLSVSGTIYPDEEVVVASEVSGKVIGIYFEEGTRIAKGKLLVKIDDSELKASLKKVKYQIELAGQQENRKKKLLEIGGISQEDYDQSLTNYNTLESEQQLIEVQIRKTEIRAPFSGTIGIRELSLGSYVNPGTSIANMVKTHPVKIEFSIPEKYSSRIPVNANISYTLEGIKGAFSGKVYAKNTSIDMETRTLLLKARSPNPKGIIIPGAFANVDIFLKEYENALMVPTEAVIPEQGGQKVFLAKGGKAQAQPISVGIRQADQIQILEGVSSGDTVILTGQLQLQPGASINISELIES